jgi:hypothetical protein
MSTSLDALMRVIDSLTEPPSQAEGPQGATSPSPVAPPNPLETQAGGHRSHRGHTETTPHGRNHESDMSITTGVANTHDATALKISSPDVAPVAHVALDIDSKGKKRGHTPSPCGPLWPLPGFLRDSASTGVLTEWSEGVALLREASSTRGYPPHAWQQLIIDAEGFLGHWGPQAARLNWLTWELFGCHRRAPWHRLDGMGLVLLLRGKELAALTGSEAVIRTATGAHQTYRRKPRDPLHPAERCLVWDLGGRQGAGATAYLGGPG